MLGEKPTVRVFMRPQYPEDISWRTSTPVLAGRFVIQDTALGVASVSGRNFGNPRCKAATTAGQRTIGVSLHEEVSGEVLTVLRPNAGHVVAMITGAITPVGPVMTNNLGLPIPYVEAAGNFISGICLGGTASSAASVASGGEAIIDIRS